MNALAQLYQNTILTHAREPRRPELPVCPSHSAEGFNPLCGDRVKVGVIVDEGGLIRDAGVSASACSICVASGSMMAEMIIGHPLESVREMFSRLRAYLDPQSDLSGDPKEEPIAAFAGVARYPHRKRCVRLPWETLEDAFAKANQTKPRSEQEL